MSTSLAIIALFPLLGSLLAYALGKLVNKDLAGWVASLACVASFIFTIKAVTQFNQNGVIEDILFTWFATGPLEVKFAFRLDALNAVMCLVVTGIGSLIHFYSIGYMAEEESRPRFFAYLNLFMFSMLLLVLGANMLVLFVGWEGVGLCSYLLIGFWFKNLNYSAAGRKAFVVNRIGDAGFLLGMFLIFVFFGTLDFVQLKMAFANLSPEISIPFALITFCLFVGAAGKSAQIPLFVWLPDAMAGPTPVSALIHAATMVTAGVYMLARLNFIFVLAPLTLAIIMIVAVLTAFIAATTALTQYDIKKVLAYSTVSQLGFMFLACAAGAFWVAIFHVVTHAFFKACLFLGAGSVIHGCHHEQDMRHMGGLAKKMPITFVTYLISTIAIAGIFPFAGYQSKHAILAALSHDNNPYLINLASGINVLVSVTAFLTAFYMMRSVMMTFFGAYKGHAHPHESPFIMTIPLVVLAVLATFGGLYLAGPLGGHDLLQNYLGSVVPVGMAHEHETIVASFLHSWVGIAGVLLAVVLYSQLSHIPGKILNASGAIGRLLQGKYYFDELYSMFIVKPLESLSRMLWKDIDQSIIDGAVNGTAALVDINGEVARYPQTGRISNYAFYMFMATLLFLIFSFWL
jgi:NADH-quinone oxidoreductase subunit L